ncbi:hypothetical protein XENTR_v10005825 [Xenopus tropicalis]|uniref:Protein THEMIS2 n=1 Tax=Xenopus tropicalis TaxID=8364 RepID=F7AUV6_XENTR|nr:protein THEMIS2 [Xenopus tropicalis]KAE8624091.1 hypothetical protein XENTR_v10005825 [Xenopus tropicalis]KAE8624092.1 hypothetical protein XENTR_v10005825 [Xenopus tropicalis]|eukprot:XP_004912375.2 PREDICTED: protein THEMIS2 [Xenopus tropicalis]
MDNSEDSVSLQDYIASVPNTSMPRIIQIASGVYLQSSIYDIKGSECCLSTGDLVKVLEKEFKFISCVDQNIGKCFELPSNFEDVFKIVADRGIYNSFADLKEKLYGDLTHPFWFASATDIFLEDRVINQQHLIKYVSPDNFNPTSFAICQVWDDPSKVCVKIPVTTVGQFYECDQVESYTLEQILQSPALLKRSYSCSSIGNGPYKLTPVYEIRAIMHMRKDIVKMPSSLEVEVIDLTDQCGDTEFIKPYSLTEVSQCEERFPAVMEIVESSDCSHIIKNDLLSVLRKGQKIIIHSKELSRKVLATAAKGKLSRFFYIHAGYEGKARQRPREFTTVYDLWTILMAGVKLNVVVTQDYDSTDGCFPSLCIGDHLKILRHAKAKVSDSLDCKETDVLVCEKDSADDEEESEEIILPLFLEGRFVEEVKDNKKYTISNLIKKFTLPCEVKVVTKDPSLPNDPLTSFASIRLEELIEEPILLASFLDNPSVCFQIPIKLREFSLIFLKDPVPKTQTTFMPLEELNESYYYSLRKDLPSKELPPPRPPKRQVKAESFNKPVREKNPTCQNIKSQDRLHSLSREKHTTEPYRSQNVNAYSPMPCKSISREEPNYEAEKMFTAAMNITD